MNWTLIIACVALGFGFGSMIVDGIHGDRLDALECAAQMEECE